MNSLRTRFYRDKQNGKFLGVCAGIADYTGIGLFWIRVGALLLIPITGGWIFPAYFVTGLLANKKPSSLYTDRGEQKFWQSVRQSPGRTAREVRAQFRDFLAVFGPDREERDHQRQDRNHQSQVAFHRKYPSKLV